MPCKTWALAAITFALTACATPSPKEQVKALLDEGIVFYQKHDYAQALPYFEQAQQAGLSSSMPKMAMMSRSSL